jgi:gluconokinase
MHRGESLNDSDLQSWLEALREYATLYPEEPGSGHIVMTCSALKREH